MNGYKGRYGWALVVAVVLLSGVAAIIAYDIGLSHGLAQGAAAQAMPIPPSAFGWYRPWGFGFPWLLFVVLWAVLLRGFWWRGSCRRHPYYAGWQGVPPAFDDWHRRAHEQMKEGPSADDPGRRG